MHTSRSSLKELFFWKWHVTPRPEASKITVSRRCPRTTCVPLVQEQESCAPCAPGPSRPRLCGLKFRQRLMIEPAASEQCFPPIWLPPQSQTLAPSSLLLASSSPSARRQHFFSCGDSLAVLVLAASCQPTARQRLHAARQRRWKRAQLNHDYRS